MSLPTSVRIYLARGATDMRKSIDGLAAVTKQKLEHDENRLKLPFPGEEPALPAPPHVDKAPDEARWRPAPAAAGRRRSARRRCDRECPPR
ncbi:MAG: IS66 family insertion sequence element accessory protein TnpB [Planctomycetes bacterium]|nr:IS66 family insertion sequence element accessory protein TnpB [Planctomycetota bacterium]MCC7399742.1 IS66 family insertion sequence element accessory protein TnpB [Planctomycetota bacterium]